MCYVSPSERAPASCPPALLLPLHSLSRPHNPPTSLCLDITDLPASVAAQGSTRCSLAAVASREAARCPRRTPSPPFRAHLDTCARSPCPRYPAPEPQCPAPTPHSLPLVPSAPHASPRCPAVVPLTPASCPNAPHPSPQYAAPVPLQSVPPDVSASLRSSERHRALSRRHVPEQPLVCLSGPVSQRSRDQVWGRGVSCPCCGSLPPPGC